LQYIIYVVMEALHIALKALREPTALLIDAADREARAIQGLNPRLAVLRRHARGLHLKAAVSAKAACCQQDSSVKPVYTDTGLCTQRIKDEGAHRYVEKLMQKIGTMTMDEEHHRLCFAWCLQTRVCIQVACWP
jgi:hypothetical protein